MALQDAKNSENTGLGWVLAGLAVTSILVGVGAYYRYAQSENYVAAGIKMMDERGKELDAEGCVDASLDWADKCDVNGTNAAVCLQGLKMTMFHCLAAKDRADACAEYVDGRPNGKWVYETCGMRGDYCQSKRECGCADAYRTLESFCLNEGERVQL